MDSGFCVIFINTDKKRHCRLILTYKNLENLVLENANSSCITLNLKPCGGKDFVLMRKVDHSLPDKVGQYSYLIRWEN